MIKKKNASVISKKTGAYQIPCSTGILKTKTRKISNPEYSAISMTSAVWKPGQKGTVSVTFGENGCSGCSPDASWSLIGTECIGVSPSMNLGFIDPPYSSFSYNGVTYQAPLSATRNYCSPGGAQNTCYSGWVPGATVIHEFGHSLSALHEHQNNLYNSDPIHLNTQAVIEYYDNLGMGQSGAEVNVLDTYKCTGAGSCNYEGTIFDPNSIMLYYLPDNWIAAGYSNPTKPNFVLSSGDIAWFQKLYPKSSKNYPVITVEFIDPNPPAWKPAWVAKIVTETYGPLIGITWNFKLPKSTAAMISEAFANIPKKLRSLANPMPTMPPAPSCAPGQVNNVLNDNKCCTIGYTTSGASGTCCGTSTGYENLGYYPYWLYNNDYILNDEEYWLNPSCSPGGSIGVIFALVISILIILVYGCHFMKKRKIYPFE